jgi:Glycosyl hydrolase family 12
MLSSNRGAVTAAACGLAVAGLIVGGVVVATRDSGTTPVGAPADEVTTVPTPTAPAARAAKPPPRGQTTRPTATPTRTPTRRPTRAATRTPSEEPTATPTRTRKRKPAPRPTATRTPTRKPTRTPTAAPRGACTDPVFTTSESNDGWSTHGYYVHNNMWNNGSGTQTLRACAYNNWNVTAVQPNTTSVKTYPNVHKDYDDVPLSSFSRITSTFGATTPHVGIYNVGYDIWLNGVATSGSTEVMIWTENFHQRPSGSIQATVSFGGHTYDVWRSGERYIAFVSRDTQLSGSMNLLAMFNWLKARNWIPQNTTVGQIDYGVEICSTNNAPATFHFNEFSITDD